MIQKFIGLIMDKDKQKYRPIHNDNEKIIIYQSELDYLSKCILESPRIETGGNLFGLWTPFGIPLIHYVVGPGPKAIHNPTHFRQDFDFFDRNADCLVKEHALHHIGSWHSHHSLGLAEPSDGDTESTLSGMRKCSLESFILLIGNYRQGKSTVNAFRYYNNGDCVKLKWVILERNSPFRSTYDKLHPDLVYKPKGEANMMRLEECKLIEEAQSVVPQAPVFDPDYWLARPENRKEFAAIVRFLKTEFDTVEIFQLDRSTVEIRITDSSVPYKFVFGPKFPQEAPTLLASEGQSTRLSVPEWEPEGTSISKAFIQYLKSIKI